MKIEELQLITFLYICKEFHSDYVLDIGSNIGFYSLVSQKYFSEPEYHCFEPTPNTFRELVGNIALNKIEMSRTTLHNIALSQETGSVDFLDFENMSGKNGISATSIHNDANAKVIKVATKRLDDMIKARDRKFLIKIDTEGHEQRVIEGAKTLISNNRCIIQMETGHGEQNAHIGELMAELGYAAIFSLGPDAYYANRFGPDFSAFSSYPSMSIHRITPSCRPTSSSNSSRFIAGTFSGSGAPSPIS